MLSENYYYIRMIVLSRTVFSEWVLPLWFWMLCQYSINKRSLQKPKHSDENIFTTNDPLNFFLPLQAKFEEISYT